MYSIAICDDSKNTCIELESILIKIFQEVNEEVEIEPWYSGESLCKYLSDGNFFDLIFLDIELIKINGVEVGKYIRETLDDLKTNIVYISYSKNYAIQLFAVQPLDFLVKPLEYNKIKRTVDIFLKRVNRRKIFLEYRVGNSFHRVLCENIIYICSDNKKIKILTADNQEIEFYGKLKNILTKLPSNFIQIHQSYIVNQDYICEANYEQIRLFTGNILSISKPYRTLVRSHLIRNIEEK